MVTAVFTKKCMLFKVAPKVNKYLGNFMQAYVTKIFQKTPNLVTLVVRNIKLRKTEKLKLDLGKERRKGLKELSAVANLINILCW